MPATGDIQKVTIDEPNDVTDEYQLGNLLLFDYEASIVNTPRMSSDANVDEKLKRQEENRKMLKSGEHQVNCFCGKPVQDTFFTTCGSEGCSVTPEALTPIICGHYVHAKFVDEALAAVINKLSKDEDNQMVKLRSQLRS